MHIVRTLVVVVGLCPLNPGRAIAQAREGSDTRLLAAGDSVRIWTRPPQPLRGFPAVVARHGADSLALNSGMSLELASLTRLEVRRVTRGRSVGGAAGGAIGGLLLGSLLGGVIGYYASGGGHNGNNRESEGMGALIGVPAGALIGGVTGGVLGARVRSRVRWIEVPLGSH